MVFVVVEDKSSSSRYYTLRRSSDIGESSRFHFVHTADLSCVPSPSTIVLLDTSPLRKTCTYIFSRPLHRGRSMSNKSKPLCQTCRSCCPVHQRRPAIVSDIPNDDTGALVVMSCRCRPCCTVWIRRASREYDPKVHGVADESLRMRTELC